MNDFNPDHNLVVQEARGLKVIDAQTYETAASYGRLFKGAIAFFESDAEAGIAASKAALETLRANLKNKVEPLEEALGNIRQEMLTYEARQKERAETRAKELAVDGAPLIISTGVPKTEGTASAETWAYEVEDLRKLIIAAANGLTLIDENGAVHRYIVHEEVILDGAITTPEPIDWPRVPHLALRPAKGFLHTKVTRLKAALDYPGVRVFPKPTIRFSA
jgi:hypothetical protein